MDVGVGFAATAAAVVAVGFLSIYGFYIAIQRHYGKQMNKETKLRIHNITAKAAMIWK